MARLGEHGPLSEEISHSLLSRSPSPTLIYPLPPSAHLPGTDVIYDSTAGNVFGDSDCHILPFDPVDNGTDWSQNNLEALDSKLSHSHSQSPEERKLRQNDRRSLKEISHMCRSVDSAAVAFSTPGRSTVVTDIDEAMAHMDQVYLKTLFCDTSNGTENCVATTDITCLSSCNDDTEETNIDDEPSNAMMITMLRQKAQNQYSWSKEIPAQDSVSRDEIVASSQVCIPFSLVADRDKQHSNLECSCDHHENLSEIVKEYKRLEKSLKEAHEEEINQLRASFSEQINRQTVQIQDLENELRQYKMFEKTVTTRKDVIRSTGDSCSKLSLEDGSASLESTMTNVYQHHNHQTIAYQVSNTGTEFTSPSESCHSCEKSDTILTFFPSPAAASMVPQLSLQPNVYNNTVPPSCIPFVSNEEVKPPPPPPPPFPPTIPMCPPPPPGPVNAILPSGQAGPPPPPPPGVSVLLQKQESSKPIINPKSPMKPLFWKRIQVHSVVSDKRSDGKNIFWEEISEEPINCQYFEELFAKTPVESKKKVTGSKVKSKTMQPAKVIQPKRSQAVGILLSSLRLDISDIEDAILNLDTSVMDIDKFKAIYDVRSDSEEMKMIKKHIETHPEIPLDKPEQFLYDLEQIPFVKDRIFCFIFQSSFQESIAAIDSKLNNLKMTCEMKWADRQCGYNISLQALSSSESVKRICGLILACGNYMNGGSRTRGQADGFDLEILPKLKDVKAKDNSTSLLQFIVSRYVSRYETDVLGTDRAKLPLPDPSDIQQAGLVNFEDTEKELKRIHKDFNSAEEKATNIIKCSVSRSLDPFKSVMTSFFDKGKQDLKEQEESLAECSKLFDSISTFFCVKPKNREQSVTPEQFFSLWISFCSDFKDIWKKEQQAVMKIRMKEAEERVKTIKESTLVLPPTRTKKIGGLKDKLSRQGKL